LKLGKFKERRKSRQMYGEKERDPMTRRIHNNNGSFICPECGHNESRETVHVTKTPRKSDPWSSVSQIMTCGKCWSRIPVHLGERWDDLSVDDAKVQWKTIYREKGKV
jgi:transcription elongation factor Elf1